MSAKTYCSNQFKARKLYLEHENTSNFYLCSSLNDRLIWPLLLVRTIIFLMCIAILLWSIILTSRFMGFSYWFLYLTHWGLLMITICSGFAWQVSLTAYLQKSIHGDCGLPWYVKVYWVTYNVAVPLAFFITIFYWGFMTVFGINSSLDPILDVFTHAMNTALMLWLVLTSRLPSHILHLYQPIGAAFIYLVFTIVYYFAGGTNFRGESWIYPIMDWSDPGPTCAVVAGSALLVVISHLILVGLSVGRDCITRRCVDRSSTITIQE